MRGKQVERLRFFAAQNASRTCMRCPSQGHCRMRFGPESFQRVGTAAGRNSNPLGSFIYYSLLCVMRLFLGCLFPKTEKMAPDLETNARYGKALVTGSVFGDQLQTLITRTNILRAWHEAEKAIITQDGRDVPWAAPHPISKSRAGTFRSKDLRGPQQPKQSLAPSRVHMPTRRRSKYA